ncbi:MAG: helix-turn-helix domain-containing protein [Lachnospiraceae bacterium]|nr:helix-turn-helix domain-containing protein [Lachnospiraceae bacterium]MCM1240224.1 helix-turn-helix domain-containing protein [Lachnospiraceae bacterium]
MKLSENIRKFRKERKMTQEQLAEVMGVSVSAVYKWESDQSTPEIHLILEMADLFRTSTDVLLGYEWRNGSAASALDRIATLTGAKEYDEAVTEAEKALKSYPNNFDIVYRSALVYLELGRNAEHPEANRRAIELLDYACALIAQNQDEAVSEVSIRTQMAKAHLLLHDVDRALRILKKYNVCGINNVLIGMVLSDCLHDADGAEKYLARAFATFAEDINHIMIGYADVFLQRKDYDAAIDCIRWLRIVLRGIQPEGTLTWFDKYDCVLLELIAEIHCFKGEFETARQFLSDAASHAVSYDHAAPGEIAGMEFFTMLGMERQPTYEEYGKTAVECLRRRIRKESDGVLQLRQLWRETIREVLPNEA